jgi:hypothetical protein
MTLYESVVIQQPVRLWTEFEEMSWGETFWRIKEQLHDENSLHYMN